MFRKTRNKIVFSIVGALLILFSVTLSVIYLSNLNSQRKTNLEALELYVQRYTLEKQPHSEETDTSAPKDDEKSQPPEKKNSEPSKSRNEQTLQLSTFYAVAFSPSGEVLAVNNGDNGMQSQEHLIEQARAILSEGSRSGTLDGLLYRVEIREDYTLVAMIDSTLTDNNLKDLMRQMLVIGLAALAVLFVISIFLARAIVRPLEENDQKQKHFISDAGHELKTPIAVVSANLELLKRQPENRQWLENIEYENEKMSTLVRQLLELTKAENAETVKEEIDFSQLVTGELLPFEGLAFDKGKQIVYEVEPEIQISGSRPALQQLVSILLDNALTHGTGEEISLSLKAEHHAAVLTVMNEAASVSETQLAHLFDRFYRAEEARSDEGSHYGLGLPIAKAVAEAHGGKLTANWKDGKAVFKAVLPLAKK